MIFEADDIVAFLGILVSVRDLLSSTMPADISVSIRVLTVILPVPSVLCLTVTFVDKIVVVVLRGRMYDTEYLVSVPPLNEIQYEAVLWL